MQCTVGGGNESACSNAEARLGQRWCALHRSTTRRLRRCKWRRGGWHAFRGQARYVSGAAHISLNSVHVQSHSGRSLRAREALCPYRNCPASLSVLAMSHHGKHDRTLKTVAFSHRHAQVPALAISFACMGSDGSMPANFEDIAKHPWMLEQVCKFRIVAPRVTRPLDPPF